MTKTLQKYGALLQKEIACMCSDNDTEKDFLGRACGKQSIENAKMTPGLQKAYDLLVAYIMYVEDDEVENISSAKEE